MRICLMIEGQEDVTWDQWLALAGACEQHGLEGLFRSDHYLSVMGRRERGSLDAWATLAGLAGRTSRIRLGTMVSPVTFRHPSVLAKMVVTVDHISGGRVELGLGAGWHQDEHTAYGFDLPPINQRMALLGEQLEVINRQWTEQAVGFEGEHYRMEGLDAMPKPLQRPRPNLIVGGSASPRSVALAARWADEYNTTSGVSLEECRRRRQRLDAGWAGAGRDPGTLCFSLMIGCVVGRDRAELLERVARMLERTGRSGSPQEFIASSSGSRILGTTEQAVEQLRAFEAAGVQRVMLQHLAHDDLDMVALIGETLVPALAG
ncbi:MAG TPA: TIGR03560 family F420-dependent LLM class oxidoreductase [Actinomycetota bacterium]|jgi:F420-dependent oxidoreductase-like protein|nr:TIGR03560 family F420-dependent LLM class oxidoreductase [Actinomycetota bacterium]